MITHVIFLILGLALIILGGNYVTNGAVAVAGRFKLSPMVIGLTVVAFGSSTPDLVVSLFSAIHGKGPMAVGNEIGAVIFDILLVVGVMAVVRPINISKSTQWVDLPILVNGAIILFFCAEFKLIDPHGIDGISRVDAAVMLAFFAIFMVLTFRLPKVTGAPVARLTQSPSQMHSSTPSSSASSGSSASSAAEPLRLWLAVMMIVGGLTALVIGGQWTVNSASAIAKRAGMSDALIGLTIVGVGSSLPDLATSLIAVFKGQAGLALGNIIGSCIMDVLMVLGVCALVRPLSVAGISIVDFITLAGSALLLFVAGMIGGKRVITRWEGVVLIALYVGYITYLIIG